jgi:hypothetical protein
MINYPNHILIIKNANVGLFFSNAGIDIAAYFVLNQTVKLDLGDVNSTVEYGNRFSSTSSMIWLLR